MRVRIASILVLVAVAGSCLLSAPPPAAAQTRDPGEVRRELERTQEVLERAREIVPPSRNERAIELLQLAGRTQENAIAQFNAGHPLIALSTTMEARRMAFRAIDLARGRTDSGGPGPGPVDLEPRALQAIERATTHLERTRDCVGDPAPAVAQRILDLAAARLEEARQAFRERRYRLAIDLSMQVGRMLSELCRGDRSENAEQLMDNVERLLERAAPAILESGQATAIGMLEEARELFQRGREAMGTGREAVAAEAFRTARDLLLQALRLADRPPDPGQVDRLLEDVGAELLGLGDEIRATGNSAAMELFQRAQEHLERARSLRQSNDLRPALAELRVARNLAFRAARLAGVRGS